jgi:oligopeptide/dipeptide ABC transporter ATP-binding protein
MIPLLRVENLSKDYPSRDGKGVVKAVNGVSLTLTAGKTLGIVGESGCGKSTMARLILRLIEASEGEVWFDGDDLRRLDRSAMRTKRREIQIVFQDPFASLDPRMTVAKIISEPLDIHGIGNRQERQAKVADLLSLVGLDPSAGQKYPHEFSGGQRQRIGIARAIALEPKLVVLDEPVSALDVSIQSQILNLLDDLKTRLGLSYIFISHDLSVVEHVSDDVAVMYLGRIVEYGPAEKVFANPAHPYTKALLSAVPDIDPAKRRERIVLAGELPNPENMPFGCPFHPRCASAMETCSSRIPKRVDVSGVEVACLLYEE